MSNLEWKDVCGLPAGTRVTLIKGRYQAKNIVPVGTRLLVTGLRGSWSSVLMGIYGPFGWLADYRLAKWQYIVPCGWYTNDHMLRDCVFSLKNNKKMLLSAVVRGDINPDGYSKLISK